jgi:hypothetical protein
VGTVVGVGLEWRFCGWLLVRASSSDGPLSVSEKLSCVFSHHWLLFTVVLEPTHLVDGAVAEAFATSRGRCGNCAVMVGDTGASLCDGVSWVFNGEANGECEFGTSMGSFFRFGVSGGGFICSLFAVFVFDTVGNRGRKLDETSSRSSSSSIQSSKPGDCVNCATCVSGISGDFDVLWRFSGRGETKSTPVSAAVPPPSGVFETVLTKPRSARVACFGCLELAGAVGFLRTALTWLLMLEMRF